MAASTPAMVLGQVEAELRRRGYKFQEDEDLIFHTDNRLLTGIGERTTDCTVVTTNALVHFENGAMERRLHRTNVIGVWPMANFLLYPWGFVRCAERAVEATGGSHACP